MEHRGHQNERAYDQKAETECEKNSYARDAAVRGEGKASGAGYHCQRAEENSACRTCFQHVSVRGRLGLVSQREQNAVMYSNTEKQRDYDDIRKIQRDVKEDRRGGREQQCKYKRYQYQCRKKYASHADQDEHYDGGKRQKNRGPKR